jgi:3-deoxy-D-manno-octulosonate 8-phosphate phosphatase (KDO 8-P phosphatase)
MPGRIPKALLARLKRVQILLCDVDGVLTDGGVFISESAEFKRFHVHDGQGFKMLARAGIKTGWISNRPSTATTQRAAELKIDFLTQDKGDKVRAAETMLRQCGLNWDQACYVGDDVVDLGVLRRVGVAISVPNANPVARSAADFVTRHAGGNGAIREVVELILTAHGLWKPIVAEYSR